MSRHSVRNSETGEIVHLPPGTFVDTAWSLSYSCTAGHPQPHDDVSGILVAIPYDDKALDRLANEIADLSDADMDKLLKTVLRLQREREF